MAKLSGPEEFFEVFQKKRPEQGGERPIDDPHAERAQAPPQESKTVTVEVRTLVTAGACAVLLIVLSYFVGLSRHPESASPDRRPVGRAPGEPVQQPGENRPGDNVIREAGVDRPATPHGVRPASSDNGEGPVGPPNAPPAMQRKMLVLQVASYNKDTPANRKYAYGLIQYLKEQRELRAAAVYVFLHVTKKRQLAVWISPFTSPHSATARKIEAAVKKMKYMGHDFKRAFFTEIPLTGEPPS